MRTTYLTETISGTFIERDSAGIVVRTNTYGPFTSYLLNWNRDDIRRNAKKNETVRGGFLPPLPYSSSWLSANQHYCTALMVDNVDGRSWAYTGFLGYPYADLQPNRVTAGEVSAVFGTTTQLNRAVVQARNNVADRVASYAESLAELRKTLQSLGDAASSIDRFLVCASQRRWGAAAKALGLRAADKRVKTATKRAIQAGGDIGSAWLAFAFGISPIINDMVSTCILLSGDWSLRCSGKALVLGVKDKSYSRQTRVIGPSMGDCKWTQQVERQGGVFVRLDYRIRSDLLRNFSKFGVTDLVQAAWAVNPYTWLVDFVIPISDALKALTGTIGLDFLGGSATRFGSVVKTDLDDFTYTPPSWRFRYQYFSVTNGGPGIGRSMQRTVYTLEPFPSPLYLKDPFDAFKVGTTLALLASKLSTFFLKRG